MDTCFTFLEQKLSAEGGDYNGWCMFTAPLQVHPYKLMFVGPEKMVVMANMEAAGDADFAIGSEMLMEAHKDGSVIVHEPADGTYLQEGDIMYRPMVNRMLRLGHVPFRVRHEQDGEWYVEGIDTGDHFCAGTKSEFSTTGNTRVVYITPIYEGS